MGEIGTMSESRVCCLVLIAAVAAFACGGDGGSESAGAVQISAYTPNPQQANCGSDNTAMPKNIGAPDTILLQVQMVNTTANDVNVTKAGSFGTVMVANEPADVGATAGGFATLPFTPLPALLVAKSGDLTVRVAFPTAPVCQLKPVGYDGQWDINVSAVLTATSGQYVTLPKTVRITW